MTDAPVRIWFTKVGENIVPNSERRSSDDIEYVRADLVEKQVKETPVQNQDEKVCKFHVKEFMRVYDIRDNAIRYYELHVFDNLHEVYDFIHKRNHDSFEIIKVTC